jgi:hypothetical protein
VQLVAPEILAIRLIRRAAEKGREILDRMDIASLETTDRHIVDHAPT